MIYYYIFLKLRILIYIIIIQFKNIKDININNMKLQKYISTNLSYTILYDLILSS